MKNLILLLLALATLGSCDTKTAPKETKSATKAEPVKETEFFETGEIRMAGKVEGNLRHGPWSSWFRNGRKNSEANYVSGKMHGPYKVWYESGQLRIEGQFDMDREVGKWYFFGESGDTLTVQDFGTGKLIK